MISHKQSSAEEQKAEIVCREFKQLQAQRANWDSHYEELAQRFLPSHRNLFTGFGSQARGEKRNLDVYDSTAVVGAKRGAAIFEAMVTPRNQTYHHLGPSDPYLAKLRDVRIYFDEVNRILLKMRYSAPGNFVAHNQFHFLSEIIFGTANLFVDTLRGGYTGTRYKAIHLGESYFSESHQGLVDKCFRRFEVSARQFAQWWGADKSATIKSALEKNPEQMFEIIHAVRPRDDLDPSRLDHRGMKYESIYVFSKEKRIVEEGGYRTFPYIVSRYEQIPGEVQGRSPAMDILPSAKTLNEQAKTVLKHGHRALDYPMLVHDDGIMDNVSLRPGAIIPGGVDANGRALVQPLMPGNIAIGKDLMDDQRMVINEHFFITIFQIMTENPQMTATEVVERTREKGILLGPPIGRQSTEYVEPLVERELDILASLPGQYKGRLLPPMPPILIEAQGEYKITHDSPIARMQRTEEVSGALRTLETAVNIAAQTGNPEALDHFEFDVMIPEIAEIQATPPKWMKDPRKIAAIREARAQQAQTQMEIDALPAVAGLAKTQRGVA